MNTILKGKYISPTKSRPARIKISDLKTEKSFYCNANGLGGFNLSDKVINLLKIKKFQVKHWEYDTDKKSIVLFVRYHKNYRA